jgi:hypothetical protein
LTLYCNPPASPALFLIDAKKERTMAETKPTRADDWEQTSAVDPHPTWRPTAESPEVGAPHHRVSELPPRGYPIGEVSVSNWFKQTFNRVPTAAKIGVILDAMAQRETEHSATDSERVFRDRSPDGTG